MLSSCNIRVSFSLIIAWFSLYLNSSRSWTFHTSSLVFARSNSQWPTKFFRVIWSENVTIPGCLVLYLSNQPYLFNPLTPVPAVTGHANTLPQFPVPAVTGREKACEDNCLSYPPWRDFGPPIVLLLLGQINQWEWTFSAYFWRTLGVLERQFLVFKSRAPKVQVIMARGGSNLQTSRVLFSFLKWTNYVFGT